MRERHCRSEEVPVKKASLSTSIWRDRFAFAQQNAGRVRSFPTKVRPGFLVLVRHWVYSNACRMTVPRRPHKVGVGVLEHIYVPGNDIMFLE